MTLEEAILHCEEVAVCSKGDCSDEHRQLAEWLKELKAYREADTLKTETHDLRTDTHECVKTERNK